MRCRLLALLPLLLSLSSVLLGPGTWVVSAQGVATQGTAPVPDAGPRAVMLAPDFSDDPPPGACPPPQPVLQGPAVSAARPPGLAPAQPEGEDRPLPINLATALQLADARPLVIAAAQASLRTAIAQYDEARLLWLPNVYLGASYYHHDGASERRSGPLAINSLDQFLAGGGLVAVVSTADAIFAPLALRQVVRARALDVQSARNEALETVAEAYFNVQQARGQLAGAQDTVSKARQLARTIEALTVLPTAPIEVDRARTELADLEQVETSAREQWRVASADLTRALRLDPRAVVVPLEPPFLQVTLIAPRESVDRLIPIGLMSRPELASQQALVQATLARLREERIRPLVPSLVLQGNPTPAAPSGFLMGGVFGSGINGHSNPWESRDDVNVQLLWELRSLGLGNRALVREREADRERAVIELFRTQDRVAAEVAQAVAQLRSAAGRVTQAEYGLKEAQTTYAGNLRGLRETVPGNLLVLAIRPQEAVSALRQLSRAYNNYFLAVNDYNRAQFRLYWALGFPAGVVACERAVGPVGPVNTNRPAPLPPVCAPPPCSCRP
jgi:outer membrane protein TolC